MFSFPPSDKEIAFFLITLFLELFSYVLQWGRALNHSSLNIRHLNAVEFIIISFSYFFHSVQIVWPVIYPEYFVFFIAACITKSLWSACFEDSLQNLLTTDCQFPLDSLPTPRSKSVGSDWSSATPLLHRCSPWLLFSHQPIYRHLTYLQRYVQRIKNGNVSNDQNHN